MLAPCLKLGLLLVWPATCSLFDLLLDLCLTWDLFLVSPESLFLFVWPEAFSWFNLRHVYSLINLQHASFLTWSCLLLVWSQTCSLFDPRHVPCFNWGSFLVWSKACLLLVWPWAIWACLLEHIKTCLTSIVTFPPPSGCSLPGQTDPPHDWVSGGIHLLQRDRLHGPVGRVPGGRKWVDCKA